MKIFDVKQIALKKIKEKNLDESIVNLLLEDVLGLSHQKIILQNITNLEQNQVSRFFYLLDEYLKNEKPLQYILGYTYFYKRKFKVNNNVLIPRFETEELVYNALKIIKEYNYRKIVDIGTGSGNIAISLKKENDNLEVLALDISIDALNVAKENALNLEANISFYHSDLLEYLINNKIKVDLIISNPPYIDYNDLEVDEIVKNNEPHLALYALDEGLYNYKKIIKDSLGVLNDNGAILFEIGYKQAGTIKEYVENNFPCFEFKVIQDIDKKDRIIYLKLK